MKKQVRIFKTLQEQEDFHFRQQLQSSPADRFRRLYQMQQFHMALHPVTDKTRKIQIGKWTS
jgi:hypothetical protein